MAVVSQNFSKGKGVQTIHGLNSEKDSMTDQSMDAAKVRLGESISFFGVSSRGMGERKEQCLFPVLQLA